jgi:hypothetical protein
VAPEYLAGAGAERAEIEAEEQSLQDAAAAPKQSKASKQAGGQQTTWGEEGVPSTANKTASSPVSPATRSSAEATSPTNTQRLPAAASAPSKENASASRAERTTVSSPRGPW